MRPEDLVDLSMLRWECPSSGNQAEPSAGAAPRDPSAAGSRSSAWAQTQPELASRASPALDLLASFREPCVDAPPDEVCPAGARMGGLPDGSPEALATAEGQEIVQRSSGKEDEERVQSKSSPSAEEEEEDDQIIVEDEEAEDATSKDHLDSLGDGVGVQPVPAVHGSAPARAPSDGQALGAQPSLEESPAEEAVTGPAQEAPIDLLGPVQHAPGEAAFTDTLMDISPEDRPALSFRQSAGLPPTSCRSEVDDVVASEAALGPSRAPTATAVGDPACSGAGESLEANLGRRFLIRSKGRWRVRSSPVMSSNVVGTLGNGTIVIAAKGSPVPLPSGVWVQVGRFESEDPTGVLLKKRAVQCQSLWCFRRNSQGLGLYEIGVETVNDTVDQLRTLDGQPVPEASTVKADEDETSSRVVRASSSFRTAERNEEAATTWMEDLSQVVSSWLPSAVFACGAPISATAVAEAAAKEEFSAEKVFERRQSEQLQTATRSLREHLTRLADASVTHGCLDPHIRRRLVRLQALAARASMEGGDGTRSHGSSAESAPGEALTPPTLQELAQTLTRLEGKCKLERSVRKDLLALCAALESDLSRQVDHLRHEEAGARWARARWAAGDGFTEGDCEEEVPLFGEVRADAIETSPHRSQVSCSKPRAQLVV